MSLTIICTPLCPLQLSQESIHNLHLADDGSDNKEDIDIWLVASGPIQTLKPVESTHVHMISYLW